MRFSLKFALSAILAKTIAAELTHMEQTQQLPNELDTKYQTQRIYANQPEVSLWILCKVNIDLQVELPDNFS